MDIPLYKIPSCLNKKPVSLGYGERQPLAQHVMKNAECNPGPNRYFKNLLKYDVKKAKSFGLSYEVYKRFENRDDIPGPASYKLEFKFGKEKPAVSIKGKKDF